MKECRLLMKTRFIILLITVAIGVVCPVFAKDGKSGEISASEVVIPAYDEDGRIAWELRASEVTSVGEDRYLAQDPVLEILAQDQTSNLAESDQGVFNLAERKAQGESRMTLTGSGFEAEGEGWSFEDKDRAKKHRFIFEENTRIAFEHPFSELLAGLPPASTNPLLPPTQSSKKKKQENTNPFPSIAYAERFEVISLKDGRHQFLLEGNVSVTTENASISCESADIQLSKGSDGVGEVSGIQATGSVNLKQLGRECWADQLMWDANDSKVSLLGNARVMDDEWGEANGEKILLEKGKGRAQVIGGKQGRSKLSLPNLPAFSFPSKK